MDAKKKIYELNFIFYVSASELFPGTGDQIKAAQT